MNKPDAMPEWEVLLLQRESARTDRPSRLIGILAAYLLALAYLPFGVIFALFVVYFLCEIAVDRLDTRFLQTPTWPGYVAILTLTIIGITCFSLIPAFLWALDEPMLRFSAVLFLVGALLHVSVVRSIHLPSALLSGLAPALVLLWLPISNTPGFRLARTELFALGCVLVLLSYFAAALLNSHRNHHKLIAARRRAECSDAAKSRFLSAMSHEMNTPLNAILGTTPLLASTADPEQRQTMQANIETAGRKLQTLIGDLLQLSATERSEITLRGTTVSLRTELRHSFTASLDRHGLSAPPDAYAISDDVPELAHLDPVQLRRCVRLLADVLLEGQPAPERFTMTCTRAATGGSRLEINLTRFGAFHAAAPSQGTHDLALSLVHQISVAMGGSLELLPAVATTSTDQAQTMTSAILRLAYRSLPPLPALGDDGRAAGCTGLRALVVDDLATNRFVIVQNLARLGVDSTEAASGAEALTLLSQQSYDVVLLDMKMPGMNGEETFAAIRDSGTGWSQVPVIAVTADTLPEHSDRYLALGLTGYIAKPVDPRVLWSEILNATGRTG